jgi:hypothetical protein
MMYQYLRYVWGLTERYGTFFDDEFLLLLEIVDCRNVLSEVEFGIEISCRSCGTGYRCYWNYSVY